MTSITCMGHQTLQWVGERVKPSTGRGRHSQYSVHLLTWSESSCPCDWDRADDLRVYVPECAPTAGAADQKAVRSGDVRDNLVTFVMPT